MSSRPSGRYPLEVPVFMRNDSRFSILALKNLLDCFLSWMASSSFVLHKDRISSVSAYRVWKPPRRPPWAIVKGNVPEWSSVVCAPNVDVGELSASSLPRKKDDPRLTRTGTSPHGSIPRSSRGIGYQRTIIRLAVPVRGKDGPSHSPACRHETFCPAASLWALPSQLPRITVRG